MTVLQSLIDKQDNVEIVRDQIGAILVAEIANQMALAPGAGKDAADFKLRIFTERSNPWEQFLNTVTDLSPLVNIWVNDTTYPEGGSNVVERQKTVGVFNLDCYGYGRSADVVAGGHSPGDKEANFEVQRAVRLVRNILMAGSNTYLQIPRPFIWQRWMQSITYFQPQIDGINVQHVTGARIAFRVTFNEFSPQYEPETLEFLAIDVLRAEDGELYFEADYDFT